MFFCCASLRMLHFSCFLLHKTCIKSETSLYYLKQFLLFLSTLTYKVVIAVGNYTFYTANYVDFAKGDFL